MATKPAMNCEPLKKLIREVPDFPKKGILFYDITTLLKDKKGFAMLIDALAEHYIGKEIDLILGTGQDGTHMIYAFPDASRLVTTNVGSGTVTIFEKRAGPRPNWSTTTLAAAPRVEGFDVSPDGKTAWAANAGDGTITTIDLATKTAASFSPNVRGANRLKFTPDGKLVLISSLGSPDLTIIRASDKIEVKRIPIGKGSAGIQIQPDGARAYVACSPDNYVAVVDLRSLRVVGHIDAGTNPDGLAWAVVPRL